MGNSDWLASVLRWVDAISPTVIVLVILLALLGLMILLGDEQRWKPS